MGLITPDIKDFVNTVKLGFAATVCADGTPNLSPKGTTIAWDDEVLAFADIYSPGTVANLATNPSIEINVVDVFTRRGYRFKGIAKVLNEGALFDQIHAHYKKGEYQFKILNIVVIHVQKISPVFSPAYDLLSEAEITTRWINYWSSVHPVSKNNS